MDGSSVHGTLQVRILEWVAMPSSRESSQPRDQTHVSHIAGISLPAELPRKPKNTGVGSLSLLQGDFPSQESNQGLLHCKWIVYPLSNQGSPHIYVYVYIYTHTYTYICMYVYEAPIYINIYVYGSPVYMCIYMNVCICIFVCLCIYIYT